MEPDNLIGDCKLNKKELKSISRKDLEKLLSYVEKALQSVKARDQRDAKKAAAKAAAQYGFSLGELSDAEAPKKAGSKKKVKPGKKPSKPVFANLDDRTQTWTGKGRQPNWFRAQVEGGTEPASMKIRLMT